VIGAAKRKIQYQQHDGNQENITVMVTICADSDSIAPTIIYKGKVFLTNWHQDNTLDTSIAHSLKGWTDGVVGSLWLEDFNEKTHNKANGRTHLLIVDSHNSHYTKEFLDYAWQHDIHILCYPAHSTHVYQGLDVVIFSPLKHCWTEEHVHFESSTRLCITKSNFITVYGRAHQKVLTPELICTAFKKTRVWPFNPNVVMEEMMALSLETSSQGHIPLPQPSNVHTIASLMHQYQKYD
ncbi:hypothetical protein PAXRUDRAFT_44437, partial [Paxillus rubicundulus Ve08.2h10]